MDQAQVLRQARGENFPVAARVLPRELREHLTAIYGYARMVDDIGDEFEGDRVAELDRIEAELDLAYAEEATEPIMVRLGATIDACALDPQPFRDLIAANRLDQTKARYQTYAELAAYCELSANTVGRMVLGVFGRATPERVAWSDAVCTGLQLVEHLQDIREDLVDKDRIYWPLEDLDRFGCTEDDLRAAVAGPRVRRLVAFEAQRTRDLLSAGTRLVDSLDGYQRVAVAGFVGGGRASLDAIEAADYEVLSTVRRPRRRGIALHSTRLLCGRRLRR